MLSKSIWTLLPALFALTSAWALPSWLQNDHSLDERGNAFFYKGFDLSSLKIEEDGGGAVYKDQARGNITRPVEDILEGMNVVRLRLWVNPKVPYDGGCE